MALLFFDLSLLPSSSSSSSSSSSANSRLLPAARALELGYAAVALDHPHRGLLADSDRCRLAPFPALSSLPLPSSASLHRSRNGSPASEPFRQYTRITLSLDSAAAAASALAPSAARLLRTYDIVAARPLTQAALDHLCQSATEADLISIDFSHKLPFRLKLPMLKLAIQRGLHFEIAYSPLINDVNSRRQVLTEAKLLVDWTKGKNLIISSAARNANEIRGPYDVINLCAYLLGLSTERAKAAMSVNCRSLISKALSKKYFYKQTVSIDRLLSSGQLDSTKCKLGDWIGWDPLFPEGDLHSLEANLKPPSKKDEVPGSAINSVTRVVYEKSCDAGEPLLVDEPKQSNDDKETPAKTQEGTAQVNTAEVLMSCGLSTSFGHQTVAKVTTLEKPGNNEVVMTDNVHAVSASSVDQKCIDDHVEFVQDAMEIDATESCALNLIAGDSAHLSLDATKLACSSLSQSMELSYTCPDDKYPVKTSDILDNAKAFAAYDTGSASSEREYQVLLNHEIPSVPDSCLEDEVMDKLDDIPVDSKVHRDTTESLGCSEGWRDDEAPLNLVLALSSSNLCKDTVLQQEVNKDKTEQNMEENIEEATSDKVGHIDSEASKTISAEHTLHGQDTSSTAFVYDKETKDTAWETNELKEPNSKETNPSLEEDIAKTHQLLNYSRAGAKGEISTARSEKRKHKLWLRRPAYLPFLGFLKTVCFKKKACKVSRKP